MLQQVKRKLGMPLHDRLQPLPHLLITDMRHDQVRKRPAHLVTCVGPVARRPRVCELGHDVKVVVVLVIQPELGHSAGGFAELVAGVGTERLHPIAVTHVVEGEVKEEVAVAVAGGIGARKMVGRRGCRYLWEGRG